MRPVIGITMSYDKSGLIRKGVEYSFIRREYGEQLRAAGADPLFIDPSIDPEAAARLCDGIVISGGEDIHPSFYGQQQRILAVMEPVERTEWERRLIDACDRRSVRVLGICYGHQLLNVHYGGTLYQDIAAEYGSDLEHGSSATQADHRITFETDFLGFKAAQRVTAAARHHQAVRDLAPGFTAVARAEDGVIEAIAGRGHFGVQWHAESDRTADMIYGAFVRVCVAAPEAAVQSRVAAVA